MARQLNESGVHEVRTRSRSLNQPAVNTDVSVNATPGESDGSETDDSSDSDVLSRARLPPRDPCVSILGKELLFYFLSDKNCVLQGTT